MDKQLTINGFEFALLSLDADLGQTFTAHVFLSFSVHRSHEIIHDQFCLMPGLHAARYGCR